MSGNINSSGSQERFALAPGESKEFLVQQPGGTLWSVDVHGDENQNMKGELNGVGTSVKLQTSETGVLASFADVAGAAATVVPGGTAVFTGSTGRYAKFINTGAGRVVVVAKPSFRVQPRGSL